MGNACFRSRNHGQIRGGNFKASSNGSGPVSGAASCSITSEQKINLFRGIRTVHSVRDTRKNEIESRTRIKSIRLMPVKIALGKVGNIQATACGDTFTDNSR